MAPRKRIDDEKARRLLLAGASIREVAAACGVSTQALYDAIRKGRLPAPQEAVA